jgi:hypothetical protein
MAAIKKISAADLAAARKAGFKRKKPKKPRAGASLLALENFVSKYNAWIDQAREKIKAANAKQAMAAKRVTLKSQIAKL